MRIDLKAVLGDAWRMGKSDRDLLLPIAGVFFFLPQFALRLFVVVAPAKAPAATTLADALAAIQQFYLAHAPALIAAEVWSLGGALAVLAFYLREGTHDVRGALRATLGLGLPFLLLQLMANVALGVGFGLFFVPGYYLLGRLILSGAIFVAEQPVGALTAIERSWARTRGHGFLLAGLGVFATVVGYLVAVPVEAIGQALDRAPLANPVSAVLIEAAGAAIVAATLLANVLIRVALYRRMAS